MLPNTACLSAGLRSLFPPVVVAAELRGRGDASTLLAAEAEYLGHAVPERAREFAAGRLCARRAIAEFGVIEFPIRVAHDRQPVWPELLVGSITHTDGYCAAVVAERKRLIAIGVDTEVVGRVGPDISAAICVPAEAAWLDSLPASGRAAAATLIFCAKEAFYKCQYPLVGEWLDPHDLRIEALAWGSARASFAVHATRPLAAANRVAFPVVGRYRLHEEFMTAGVVFPAEENKRT